jgi:ribosome-associated protein
LDAGLVINEKVVIPFSEFSIIVSRSSGPGGQHVNKTSSRVSLRWNIWESQALTKKEKNLLLIRLRSYVVGEGEILIHVESERSQLRNKEIAKERLVNLVKKALIPKKKRLATKPTLGSKVKRLANKKKRSYLKTLRKPHGQEE